MKFYQPLEQFETHVVFLVQPLRSAFVTVDFVATNLILFFVLAISITIGVCWLPLINQKSLGSAWSELSVLPFTFLKQSYGSLVMKKYENRENLLFLLTLFIFIISNNLLGLVPQSFCETSQLFVALTLSTSVFFGVTTYGLLLNGKTFMKLFIPSNVPKLILPFLVGIEIISYVSRVLSLAIRLFANMLSGHALLHILTEALYLCTLKTQVIFVDILLILPICLIITILALEIIISFLQAYVFITLSTIYLNDCILVGGHD